MLIFTFSSPQPPPKGEIDVCFALQRGEGSEKFFAKRRISPFGGGWGVEKARHKFSKSK